MSLFRIVFDQAKRDKTFAEREVAFEDAAIVFEGKVIEYEDVRRSYPEPRYISAGLLSGRLMIIVWTPVDASTRRVISMRKANAREQKIFAPYFE